MGKFNRLRYKLLLFITGVYAAVGIALGGLLYTIWPQYYFTWYPSIPLYYYVVELVMLVVLERANRKQPDKIVTCYMVTRLAKLVLTIVFLWLYLVLVDERIKYFGLTLMLFYFIHLTFETSMFYLYEKRRMKKK